MIKLAIFKKGNDRITHHLYRAIAYITDKEKTENGTLVSTFHCGVKQGHQDFLKVWNRNTDPRLRKNPVLAHHWKQSFKPGEVSPDEAHQIGLEFCERYLKGKFQYILTTHVDKDHIHNHLIFNHVNFLDHKVYEDWQDIPNIRKISDDICREHGLFIIEPEKSKEYPSEHFRNSRSYFEDMCLKKGVSWKAKIQSAIDLCIRESESYSDFLSNIKDIGLQYDDGKTYLKIKFPEQQKFIRCKEKTLGKDYSREAIQKRIKEQVALREKIESKPSLIMQDPNFIKITKPKVQGDIEMMLREEKTFENFLQRFSSMGYSYDAKEKVYYFNDETRSITCPEIRLKKDFHMRTIQASYRAHEVHRNYNQFVDYKIVNRTKYAMEAAIKHASSFNDFLQEMTKRNYEYKWLHGELFFKFHSDSDFIPVLPETFGTDYTKEMIAFHINHKTLGQEDIRVIKYEQGLTKNDVLQRDMAIVNDSYLLLKRHGIYGFSEIPEAIDFYEQEIRKNNLRIEEIKEALDASLTDLKLKSIVTDLYNENRRLKSTIGNLNKIQGNYERYLIQKERHKNKEQDRDMPTL